MSLLFLREDPYAFFDDESLVEPAEPTEAPEERLAETS